MRRPDPRHEALSRLADDGVPVHELQLLASTPMKPGSTVDFQSRQNAGKSGRGGGIRTPGPLLPKLPNTVFSDAVPCFVE